MVVDLNRGAITLGESVDALPKWDSAIESYLLRACTMVRWLLVNLSGGSSCSSQCTKSRCFCVVIAQRCRKLT